MEERCSVRATLRCTRKREPRAQSSKTPRSSFSRSSTRAGRPCRLRAHPSRRSAGKSGGDGSTLGPGKFYLVKESYSEAFAAHFRDLTPTIPYILDYHILATTFDEDVIGDLRRSMQAAGIPVESSKGEAWPGQHEINFRFSDALTTADRHAIYKNGAKEIANKHGQAITFMAKPDHSWIGNSCHIHSSLWSPDGSHSLFVTENGKGPSAAFNGYRGGLAAHMRELSIFVAPNINSYKR
jgi:glutamine synthetase